MLMFLCPSKVVEYDYCQTLLSNRFAEYAYWQLKLLDADHLAS